MFSPEPHLAALMTFYKCFIVLMFGEFPTKFLENICDKLHNKVQLQDLTSPEIQLKMDSTKGFRTIFQKYPKQQSLTKPTPPKLHPRNTKTKPEQRFHNFTYNSVIFHLPKRTKNRRTIGVKLNIQIYISLTEATIINRNHYQLCSH